MMKKVLLLSLFQFLLLYSVSSQEDGGNFYLKLSEAAKMIVDPAIRYDPAYTRISYPNGDVPKVVHNYGHGQVCEDILFRYKITGHYRYKK